MKTFLKSHKAPLMMLLAITGWYSFRQAGWIGLFLWACLSLMGFLWGKASR